MGVVIGVVLAAVLLMGGVLAALLVPAVTQAREAARRAECKNNLKQIGLALHNYHDVYKTFPPAYIADENGKPLYSWRVLILPFIGQQPLYEQFDKSKAWDDPVNQFALHNMPPVFGCPSDPNQPNTTTNYAAVFGENCVFSGPVGIPLREITDGSSNTLIVGEVTGANIPWTAPMDVEIAAHPTVGDPQGFSSHHPGGAQFLGADGAVHFVSETIDPGTLTLLFERNDGQVPSIPE
jgi:hypothetical protein